MKLNGYRASHKNKWFLITKKILTSQEFLLFEYYLDLMAFDIKNVDLFAKFQAYPEEIAVVFNKTEESINTWNDGLIVKGFIKLVNKKRCIYTVKFPLRYIVGLDQWRGEASKYAEAEKNKSEEYVLENMTFFLKKEENILKKNVEKSNATTNTPKNSLISSNNDLSSSPIICKVVTLKQKIRTPEEYQRLYKESNSQGPTPEDMSLIDENAHEEVVVENEEHAQKIVAEWFDGNWDEYKKACHMASAKSMERLKTNGFQQ